MADRPLHIAVDGRELLGRPTGVGRYLAEVLGAWVADPAWPHRVTIVAPHTPPGGVVSRYPRIRWLVEAGAGTGTWWEQTRLARAAANVRADVLFAPAYTAPLRLPCPLVLTIHDLSYFAHPEWFTWREGARRRWLTRAAARRAAAILTVSDFAAADIVTRLEVPRSRVHVVRHGVPKVTGIAAAHAPHVLYVGSLFERRHVPELVHAFAGVAAALPAARLTIIGEDRSRTGLDPKALAARHGIASRVEWHPYVSEDELARRYRNARAFAFLSDYEGFGMTPLEAMAFGVPPVVLDTVVAREVYGDAAIFVQGLPAEIAHALIALLTDDALHGTLVRRGLARAREFSWATAAHAIREHLERAVP
jgi:glycosyltransferase involved in cell wall biosynthesis